MSTIIFDFDGTLADTYHLYLKAINQLARKYHYKQLIDSKVLRGKNMREIIKNDLKLNIFKTYFYTKDLRKFIKENNDKIKMFDGIKKMLIRLHKNNKLFIISSNASKTINKVLIKEGVKELFSEIHCESSLFGKDKVIKKFLKKHCFNKDDCYYICDEIRDVESVKKTGIKIIAVSWGYNNKKSLKKAGPDFFVNKPEEILKIFK